MYSLQYIKAINKEKSEQAEMEGATPYIAKFDGDEGVRAMPFLGDYIPKGYKIVNIFFVDSSGFGSESEMALTLGQFLNKVRAGFGYAIKESGQFQVYINEYMEV